MIVLNFKEADMKAGIIDGYGSDALRLRDKDRPGMKDNQVLVEVHAASVNPFDWKLRDGVYKDSMSVNFPAILGGDLAGVVVEAGGSTTGFKKGDEVFGQANAVGQGSFAEFSAVNSSQLSMKPKSVDFVTAAALPLTGAAAYQALVETIKLGPSQKILIHGGAGGIGLVAVQLAKHIGAYVAATVSSRDMGYVKALGADEVLDYKQSDFSKLLEGYDAVLDTVGGDVTARSYNVLRRGGSLVSMLSQADPEKAEQYQVNFIHLMARASSDRLDKIAGLVDAGVIKARIDRTFSLDETNDALDYQKSGHPAGKVVISIR